MNQFSIVPEGTYQTLEPQQIQALISVMSQPWDTFYLLLWESGVRVSEGLNLKAEDLLDGANGPVLKVNTLKQKAAAYRLVPIANHQLWAKLRAVKPYRKYLFPYTRQSAWKALRRAAKALGMDTSLVHPHVFRHSFAVNFFNRFGDDEASKIQALPFVQALLGHKSIQSTGVYLKPTWDTLDKQFRRVRRQQ